MKAEFGLNVTWFSGVSLLFSFFGSALVMKTLRKDLMILNLDWFTFDLVIC